MSNDLFLFRPNPPCELEVKMGGGGGRELLWNILTKQKMTPWLVCFDFELGECVIKELIIEQAGTRGIA